MNPIGNPQMMKMKLNRAALAVLAFSVVGFGLEGCRYKGGESFLSATTVQEHVAVKGDPYTRGGIADATGGVNPSTNYGKGADPKSPNKVSSYDQPAKGVGQQPGEAMVEAAAGHGKSNAPAFQSDASSSSSTSTR